MSASPSIGLHTGVTELESFWLPPHARGNGFLAARWVRITVLSSGAETENVLLANGGRFARSEQSPPGSMRKNVPWHLTDGR